MIIPTTLIGINLNIYINRTGYWIIISITLVFEEVFKCVTEFIPYILLRSFILFLCLYNDGAEQFLENVILPMVNFIHRKLFPGEENNKNMNNQKSAKYVNNSNESSSSSLNSSITNDLSNLPSLPKNPNIKDAAVAAKELLKDEDEECCDLPKEVTDANLPVPTDE